MYIFGEKSVNNLFIHHPEGQPRHKGVSLSSLPQLVAEESLLFPLTASVGTGSERLPRRKYSPVIVPVL